MNRLEFKGISIKKIKNILSDSKDLSKEEYEKINFEGLFLLDTPLSIINTQKEKEYIFSDPDIIKENSSYKLNYILNNIFDEDETYFKDFILENVKLFFTFGGKSKDKKYIDKVKRVRMYFKDNVDNYFSLMILLTFCLKWSKEMILQLENVEDYLKRFSNAYNNLTVSERFSKVFCSKFKEDYSCSEESKFIINKFKDEFSNIFNEELNSLVVVSLLCSKEFRKLALKLLIDYDLTGRLESKKSLICNFYKKSSSDDYLIRKISLNIIRILQIKETLGDTDEYANNLIIKNPIDKEKAVKNMYKNLIIRFPIPVRKLERNQTVLINKELVFDVDIKKVFSSNLDKCFGHIRNIECYGSVEISPEFNLSVSQLNDFLRDEQFHRFYNKTIIDALEILMEKIYSERDKILSGINTKVLVDFNNSCIKTNNKYRLENDHRSPIFKEETDYYKNLNTFIINGQEIKIDTVLKRFDDIYRKFIITGELEINSSLDKTKLELINFILNNKELFITSNTIPQYISPSVYLFLVLLIVFYYYEIELKEEEFFNEVKQKIKFLTKKIEANKSKPVLAVGTYPKYIETDDPNP